MGEELTGYENMAQQQKSEILEQAVLTRSPEEVSALCRQLGHVENTARALGLACRFSGLAYVQALVREGAEFTYKSHSDEYFFAKSYWLAPLEMNGAMRMAYRVDRREGCFKDVVAIGEQKCHVLPAKERAEIAVYLYENREKIGLDAGEFLFYAIMSNSKDVVRFLREAGVKLTEQRIAGLTEDGRSYEWQEFSNMTENLEDGEYREVVGSLAAELGGKRFHYTESIYWGLSYRRHRLYKPEIFRFVLDHFNQKKINKSRIMKGVIDQNSVTCLEICAENGWLDMPGKRDEMISYATEKGETECQAWLLEFKNRTADFAAEREKAEKKMMRELNANPNSVTELRKRWGYEACEDNTLAITRYRGSSTVVEVPEKIGGSTVAQIGGWAFSARASRLKKEQAVLRRSITQITLPQTVCAVGEAAFFQCESLEQIYIPDSVTVIGAKAFFGCGQLAAIELPGGITEIGEMAFQDCGRLEEIRLPEGITVIGNDMFWNCHSLQRVTIPSGVSVIRRCAFYGCAALETVVIPEGVVEIGQLAFANCKKLKSVVLPQSVQKIKNATRKGQAPKTIFAYDTDVTITVTPKSYAEKYCKRNQLRYVYPEGYETRS